MKRVLLIGGRGLVGNTFQALYQSRFELTALGREAEAHWDKVLDASYDCCIFLAQSREYRLGAFTADMLRVNVNLVRETLAACADRIPQFILFSSGSVYEPSGAPCTEDAPLDWSSRSPYVLSKLMGEMVARTFSAGFESLVLCRPFAIFGPGQHPGMLFERLRQDILNQREITLGQNGGLLFNPVLAHDVCASLERLIEDRPQGCFAQNLYGAEQVLLADVVILLGKKLGITPRVRISDQPLNTVLGASLNAYNVAQHRLEAALDVFLRC